MCTTTTWYILPLLTLIWVWLDSLVGKDLSFVISGFKFDSKKPISVSFYKDSRLVHDKIVRDIYIYI